MNRFCLNQLSEKETVARGTTKFNVKKISLFLYRNTVQSFYLKVLRQTNVSLQSEEMKKIS